MCVIRRLPLLLPLPLLSRFLSPLPLPLSSLVVSVDVDHSGIEWPSATPGSTQRPAAAAPVETAQTIAALPDTGQASHGGGGGGGGPVDDALEEALQLAGLALLLHHDDVLLHRLHRLRAVIFNYKNI